MIGISATLALAAILLITILAEPDRQQAAMVAYWQRASGQAIELYVHNCVNCHGLAGEGIDLAPPLNSIRGKDPVLLFRVIERGRFGTDMAAFGMHEGGGLTDPQIESLLVLITHGSWDAVAARASNLNIAASWTPTATLTPTFSSTPAPTRTPSVPLPEVVPTVTYPPPPVFEIIPTAGGDLFDILATPTTRP
jgi:mono/diheme cytochrome c family protein